MGEEPKRLELVTPPPTVVGLRRLSNTSLVAILLAGMIAFLDAVAATDGVLSGLLAVPPLVAAIRATFAETAAVGAFCLLLAILAGTWNDNFGATQYVVSLLTVSAGAIVGLWVARMRWKLDREQVASEILADAGRLMEIALDQRERAGYLADLAVPELGDVAMVDMLTPDGTIERIAARSGGSEVAEVFSRLRAETPIDPAGPHPVAEVIRTGERQLLGRLSDQQIDEIASEESERRLLRRHRFQSCLVLPLGARGALLGALTLWIMKPGNSFDETARRTAKRLADRAALALDNARLHEQQAHIASVLQHSLRPRSLPEIAGFEAASRFLAAGEAYEVGGDFYDVFRTGSGVWSVVIGDVCGKGPEAASLTALARYTVRTASTPESPPSAVLRTLHDSISEEHTDLRFCTAALARIQAPRSGNGAARLTVALGGHPAPLALRAGGQVEAVGRPGTLLGALPIPTLADVEATLSPGEMLVFYTDGMLELRDRGGKHDPDWLANQLAQANGASADEVAQTLSETAIRRQGGEPRDDIAVVVLRRRGD
jgi:serine phosphatase RsbU (regulator of sigma subunit)